MAPARLVGVFDADGSLRGELAYLAGKVLGRRHCALCDITHGWSPRPRRSFLEACQELTPPLELMHRDEVRPDVAEASAGTLPCVLVDDAAGLSILLGPDELEACAGSPERLRDAIAAALAARGAGAASTT